MSEYKSLRDLWKENDQKPLDAITSTGEEFHLESVSPSGAPLGWGGDGEVKHWWNGDSRIWKLDKPEPKLVPHYKALLIASRGAYFETSAYYQSEEVARSDTGDGFIKLLTDQPLMLPEVNSRK